MFPIDVQNLTEDLKRRGITLSFAKGKLNVSPASLLTADDRKAILACRDELSKLLGSETASGFPACPGACPGALEAGCCGGPHPEVELLYQSGLVTTQWCTARPDAGACWQRQRGTTAWQAIPGRHAEHPTTNHLYTPLVFMGMEDA